MAPSAQSNTFGFIPGLAKTFSLGSVAIGRPRVCISKTISGAPVANKSFKGVEAAFLRPIRTVTPAPATTCFQSPIVIPNNGTVPAVHNSEAPVIKEGTHVRLKSKLAGTGTNVEMDVESGSDVGTVTYKGTTYKLVQLHMHHRSENKLGFDNHTQDHPIEMHLVHEGPRKELLVLGIFFEGGSQNDQFDNIMDAMQNLDTERDIDVSKLIDEGVTNINQLLTFEGSLTTPPFTSGVEWVVSKQPAQVHQDQIDRYTSTPHVVTPNNRPTQDLGTRIVQTYF